jgi:PhoH-like ATPase
MDTKTTGEPVSVVIDTNILIDHPEVLLDKSIHPLIPYTVLAELDNLKRNPDLKRAAQAAIKLLKLGMDNGTVEVTNIPTAITTPDEKIVKAAKTKKVPFMSNDIGAMAIAKARKVELMDPLEDETIDYDYTGMTIVEGSLNYEQDFKHIKDLPLAEFNSSFGTELKENQYCIIDRVGDKDDIWVNHSGTVYRISQSMKPYRDAGVLISPMDNEQMCALDAIFNPSIPLTVIDGELGTGKTLLTLMGALACSNGQAQHRAYEKILVTKPPVSVNRNLYTGYKPGTSEEKMSGHLGGIKSNLKFLLDKSIPAKQSKRKVKEDTKSQSEEVWEALFGIVEIDEIQGTSLHSTCLIVDEYQLLDTDMLKLVLSRISEGSKVILVGDAFGQTYGMNRANEGYKTLYKYLGTAPEFNYIKLNTIYRSPLAAFVAKIFE